MASSFGENIKLSIFGTSHGPSIGMTLEGIPAGLPVDFDKLQAFLNRRAPGQNPWSTSRKEADVPVFESGISGGFTTGETITATIANTNVRKSDYDELKYIPRPGHADFAAWMKYGLDFDMSGGGPFSGRMTAPMCIAGGLCKQWLENKGIRIYAHIESLGTVNDEYLDPVHPQVEKIYKDFPVINPDSKAQMLSVLSYAKETMDSVGGVIACAILGLPAGVGEPMFGGVEGRIATAVYGIPAVKGVEFGDTQAMATLYGSWVNDAYTVENGAIRTATNNCGGILGGITNGMPVIFRAVVKPTPSIGKPQKSVNMKTMEEVTIQIKGRHDPCIVPRAVPVVEAAAAIAIYDLMAEYSAHK